MAVAYVSYHQVALTGAPYASSVLGRSVYSAELTIGGSEQESAVLATTMGVAVVVARVTTDDTACYVATGTAPDTTVTARTAASSARFYLGAGATVEFELLYGERVAVKAVS